MRGIRDLRKLSVVLLVVIGMIAAACGGDGGGESTGEEATEEPYKVGWLTDASGPARDTYFPESEGVRLYMEELNARGGIDGHPVEVLVEDVGLDAEKHASIATKFVETDDVHLLAGGTIEALQPPVYEVARSAEVPYISSHSARPDMMPPNPDPWLFTIGFVFEAMSDARVDLWPQMFDGGTVGCYIHEAPAATAICDRWVEIMAEEYPEFDAGPIVNAPIETADFAPFVRPICDENPDQFFDISIASHTIGVAVAVRNCGYEGPIAVSMPAVPEYVVQQIADQVGPENLFALSNLTSVYEEDVPEIQAILEAAEEQGTELEPSVATVDGWLLGIVIEEAFKACGWPCDPVDLRDAMETLNVDTRGLTGGNLEWTAEDHSGKRWWTAYEWDGEKMVRVVEDWLEFDPATDLKRPLAEQ